MDSRLPDGIADIRRDWTFRDLVDAHIALDTMDKLRPREGVTDG
jgi:hypothetical protein